MYWNGNWKIKLFKRNKLLIFKKDKKKKKNLKNKKKKKKKKKKRKKLKKLINLKFEYIFLFIYC